MEHCYKNYFIWIIETYGFQSDERIEGCKTGDALCMLPRDHRGPHEWTPTRDVVVDSIDIGVKHE